MRNTRSANGTKLFEGFYIHLHCRTNYQLQVHSDGTVNGTRDANEVYAVLRLYSVAVGIVRIKGIAAGKYICMNKKGRLFGQEYESNECDFSENIINELWYNTYSSYKYPKQGNKRWYIALSNKGKARRGDRSKKQQKFSQFLIMKVNFTALQEKYKDDLPRLLPSIRTGQVAPPGR